MTELPATTDEETGVVTEHFVYQSPNTPTEILNYKKVSLTGF
jgi:hypothetical protein